MVSRELYSQYMQFNEVEPNPWREEVLTKYLKQIGAAKPETTDKDVQAIRFCYDQQPQFRSYHGPDHGAFVGQPDAPQTLLDELSFDDYGQSSKKPFTEASLALAGLWHDAAYKHVDAIDDKGTRAWPSVLQEQIGDFADYTREEKDGKPVYRTFLTDKGKNDPVTQMVAHIFEVGGQGIIHNEGGNEFDSALGAAKWLEKHGVPPKAMIGIVAAIAATVPFKPAVTLDDHDNIVGDGHMGELAHRVKSATLSGYTPDWDDTNDMMLRAVHLANRDIAPFIQKDNFAGIVNGGRAIKKEELPGLRRDLSTMDDLVKVSGLEASAPLLYSGFAGAREFVPPENVPHFYMLRDENGEIFANKAAYPPVDVYQQAVKNTVENTMQATAFFKAHEVGISLAASIATLVDEPHAPVPGFVSAKIWHERAQPTKRRTDMLTKPEQPIFDELMQGKSQQDFGLGATQRSPIAGIVFGAAGGKGIEKLSERIKEIRSDSKGAVNPFADREAAADFIETVTKAIGLENFKTITTELHRVAEYYKDDPQRGNLERAAKLEALGNGLQEYASQTKGRSR